MPAWKIMPGSFEWVPDEVKKGVWPKAGHNDPCLYGSGKK